MRSIKFYLLFLITIGLLSVACSELQNDVVLPTKIGTHGPDVFTKSSPSFHGKIVIGFGTGYFDGCRQCHAYDLSGGLTQVSCATSNCHPSINVHTAGIMNKSSQGFHGKYIAGLNWNMRDCAKCHGTNYAGGISSPTCNSCHTNSGGPEACNTCHGDFSNPNQVSPPKALNDATITTDPGVGAHTIHLTGIKTAQNVVCNECHIVPSSVYAAGHLDSSSPRAEVTFGSFTNSGVSGAFYNFTTNTCANTYCHGNFAFSKATSVYPFAYTADKITGANYSPKWTKVDGTEGKCGTCHGLPPAGHMASTLRACATCHQGIVDENGKIIDTKKHLNGKINVFGN